MHACMHTSYMHTNIRTSMRVCVVSVSVSVSLCVSLCLCVCVAYIQGTPGSLTRLLSSAGGPDYLAQSGEIPTHVSPPWKSPLPNDFYKPYNKPWSITKWLEEAMPKEDVIVIVDPDCMFVKKMEINVEEGSPVAQQASTLRGVDLLVHY